MSSSLKFQVMLAGKWVNYPAKAERIISDAYRHGQSEVEFSLKVGRKQNKYKIKFSTMQQTSLDTGRDRPVRPPFQGKEYDVDGEQRDSNAPVEYAGDDASDADAAVGMGRCKSLVPQAKPVEKKKDTSGAENAVKSEFENLNCSERLIELVGQLEKVKGNKDLIVKGKEMIALVQQFEKAMNGTEAKNVEEAAKKCNEAGLKGPLLDAAPTRIQEMLIAAARIRVQTKLQETRDMKNKTAEELEKIKEDINEDIKEVVEIGLSEEEVRPLRDRIRKAHNMIQDLKGAIRVYCRTRPFNERERNMGSKPCLKFKDDKMTVSVENDDGDEETFVFDTTFNPGSQGDIFVEMKELVQSAYDGFNVTVFAYGQTGSGKTFTMYGPFDSNMVIDPNMKGVVSRSIDEVFVQETEYSTRCDVEVSVSMIELYCGKLNDLTGEDTLKPVELTIRRTPEGETVVDGAVFHKCTNAAELWGRIAKGFANRQVACTAMNAESSRSHLLVTVKIVTTNKTTGKIMKGKLVMVDLAGSERVKDSMVEGDALKEAIEINKSLTVLGDVMEQLTTGGKNIGYRNHPLTMLLQDSLGGTAKTLMFANLSPASVNLNETIMTCKWATRAKNIVNDGTAQEGQDDGAEKAAAAAAPKKKPAAKKKR